MDDTADVDVCGTTGARVRVWFLQEILFRLREDVHGHNVAKRGSNGWDACERVVRASLRSATFALSAGGTPAVPVKRRGPSRA